MGEPTDLGPGIVQHDGDAATQADSDQDIRRPTGSKIGNPNQDLAAAHAARR
jgi:hypothetical protein